MKKLDREQVNSIIFYIFFSIVCVILIYIGTGVVKNNKKRMSLKRQVNILEKETDFMLQENEILKSSKQEFLTQEAFEKEARIMLGLRKEGESVVILNQNEETEIEQNTENKNIFNNIADFFKNIFK